MNNFLTCKNIARQALPILQNNLVFPALIHSDYSDTFSKKGDTIQVRKPPIYTANEFEDQITVQDAKESEVLVKLDKIADVSIELSAKEMALNLDDFTHQFIEPAIAALAEKINRDGHALYKDIPYFTGEAGVTPNSLDAFARANKVLNDNKAPTHRRAALWNTDAIAAFQTLPALANAEKSGSTTALRNGSIGRVFGIQNYMSQEIPNHTASLTVSGAITASGTVGGTEVKLSASSMTGKLVKGDLLKIGDKPYTVTEDATAASNAVTAKIYPALAETGTAELIGNHAANLAFNRNAFCFVTRPLEVARGADSYVTAYNGITLRVTMDYNIATKKQTLSIDTLYGFKTLYPELAVRYLA